jgi:hypothetical protein
MVAKALRSPDLAPLVIPSPPLVPRPPPSTDSLDSLSALFTSTLVLSQSMTNNTEEIAPQVVYIQPSHKFPSPERYAGSHDGFSCLAWLQSLTFYVKAIKAPETEWTRIGVSYLTGAAILWWHGSGLSDDDPYCDFSEGLKAMFLPEGFIDTVRARLYQAKLTTTVPALIQDMRMCMDILRPDRTSDARKELEESAKSILMIALPAGLQEMLQAFLIGKGDANWNEICNAAVRYAKIRKIGTDTNQAVHNSLATQHATHPVPDPMAMEIDNISTATMAALLQQINHLSIQVNNLSRDNNRNRLSKLTPTEKEKLIKQNKCFRCRQSGHRAINCQGPTHINNAEMTNESGSQSGNAPGN